MKKPLLRLSDCGLYCEDGGFYIDPWKPVEKALITHAHSDHARWGSKYYLAAKGSESILRLRLGNEVNLQIINYSENIKFNNINVSFHPAGHILGSAQIRVERNGEVYVFSGDYKIEPDNTCRNFELLKSHTFITESTFGLPIYKWCSQKELFEDINNWWSYNSANNISSIIFSYALGKAQRVLSGLNPEIGPILTHGAVENINKCYRYEGISELPLTTLLTDISDKTVLKKAIVIAPPLANSSIWLRKFGVMSTAFASGWMQVRGNKRRHSVDKGFALSDHADWDALLYTIKETGAENICITHGYTSSLIRWLRENGYNANIIPTQFEGERIDEESQTINNNSELPL